MRLLIADDERMIRETISTFIDWHALGIEVVATCKDGIEAYNAIIDEYPDIVLTDIKMPGFSGLELIERIKQKDPYIEFIILSGYEDFNYAKKAMQYGVRHYLLKPCNEKQIIEAVNDIKKNWYLNQFIKNYNIENDNTKDSPYASSIETNLKAYINAAESGRNKIASDIESILNTITDKEFLLVLISGLLLKYADSTSISYSPMQIMEYVKDLKKKQDKASIAQSFLSHLPDIFKSQLSDINSSCGIVKKTIDYIDSHLADTDLSLKNIAQNVLFMNVDYVSKVFIKETGVRFSDYLNTTRIEKAKRLLTKKDSVQIAEVAEQLGLGNNPQYFYILFKKYTGVTPTTYIKSWKQGDTLNV